ncbi:hypothetical protein JX265_001954 [Neoarthrinium moseri]|uniref:gamma-glutamylcyclotransferase n=1 Tax=Neoarthrinium moseri TaxID=1658444 RepID=A0A9P9WWH2_9PEZI|nr:hypothetical protein JX265_001954 [Neoarthrinium moseri]
MSSPKSAAEGVTGDREAQQTTTTPTLYFAYGSNLSPTQMQSRCPGSIPLGLARLRGWSWLINARGYANIVRGPAPSSSSPTSPSPATPAPTTTTVPGKSPSGGEDATDEPLVYGLLYRLAPRDEATLDVCEGVPWAYQRAFVDVTPLLLEEEEKENGRPMSETAAAPVRALVYVDGANVTPGRARDEYVGRMNRGIREAGERWGLDAAYVEAVMRRFIPGDGQTAEKRGKGGGVG